MDHANKNKSSCDNGATTPTAKGTGLPTGEVSFLAKYAELAAQSELERQFDSSTGMEWFSTYLLELFVKPEPPTT